MMESYLENLKLADPDTWEIVRRQLVESGTVLEKSKARILVDNVLWGLTVEVSLGRALAGSLANLLARQVPACWIALFLDRVRKAAASSATLGRIQALYLAEVAATCNKNILRLYQRALDVMLGKGSYTLPETLKQATQIIRAGQPEAAAAYLELLATVFSHDLTYNRSMHLVYVVPRAVAAMDQRRRHFQIIQMERLAGLDVELIEDYIAGLEKGLALLSGKALQAFVDQACRRLDRDWAAGRRFLALAAADARQQARSLQTAVSLGQIKGRLDNYLRARTSMALSVAAVSTPVSAGQPRVTSNGRKVLLTDPLDFLPEYDLNLALAKAMVRLEACYYEFGTFEFDLEKASDRHGLELFRKDTDEQFSDLEYFLRSFSFPALAADLLTFCEHRRLLRLARRKYPGLARNSLPFIQRRAMAICKTPASRHPLWPFYCRHVLNLEVSGLQGQAKPPAGLVDELLVAGSLESAVEDSAVTVWRCYPEAEKWLKSSRWLGTDTYQPLELPFGWRIDWRSAKAAWPRYERRALEIRRFLDGRGIKVYRSEVKKLLVRTGGNPSVGQVAALVVSGEAEEKARNNSKTISILSGTDIKNLLAETRTEGETAGGPNGDAYYYHEWDCNLQDYLPDHTRIQERQLESRQGEDFYNRILTEHGLLVAGLRRAFECLKPEALGMLRPWREGDALDYRALIEYAVDRHTRRQASDRIFIKRLKHQRDVAVMLLVDLSRSTANPVASGRATVLEVEKEALVVFCEALEVVGDSYAIAGFSGTGPLSVDFFRIKDFNEKLKPEVKARISALEPQRSTRMGAALRHASALLDKIAARIKLLVILGDGFPNDLDYKHDYAIADTRRAVQEASACHIHVRAVTVNMGSDPRLDELYGKRRHYVIENVLELPDKLVRLYSTMTRH